MPHQPVQVFALEIPPGDVPIPAHFEDLPANIRITMAAVDPSSPAQLDLAPAGQSVARATLKIVKINIDEDEDEDDEDYDSDDIAALEARLKPVLGDSEDDSEEDEDSEEESDEEKGGPSDPAKSKQARKDAAVKALLESLKDDDEMDTDELPNGINGVKKNKGKARASDDDEEDSDLDDEEGELEEHVICTLDTTQHYQQPIDITINEGEQVFFKVIGTHSVFLTGNYVAEVNDDDEDDEYSDDDDEMGGYYGDEVDVDSDDLDEEIDELDDLADPRRITEVDSDEEDAPKLIMAAPKAEKKGKNKRSADDLEEATTLDALISKAQKADATTNGEKLSKKQAKKLKNNQGQAVAGAEEKDKKEVNGTNGVKSDKKVQFAKNLEQGPTGSPLPKSDGKEAVKREDASPKSALGVKVVQGVKIDDKKLGKGPAAKKGDKVGMRYIGKLESGKVFDSNKKGKPFQFNLGKGEVISGWDIGVAGMTVGGERRLTIPAKLAYGAKGVPGIPGNSTLIFDVKLISVN